MSKPLMPAKQKILRLSFSFVLLLSLGPILASAFNFLSAPPGAGPTMALFFRAVYSKPAKPREAKVQIVETDSRFTFEQGAIVRGDRKSKKLAIVFTGDEFADGAEVIERTLKRHKVQASFFFTGRFYRNADFKRAIRKLKRDNHYLGAHSDAHLLYCDWNDRQKLLISRREFEEDLDKNYAAMRAFGVSKSEARFFLPPFEWYNRSIGDWTKAMDLQLINFTAGTRSNADYTTPETKNYVSSEAILKRIKEYEAQDPDGLNGFILLLHVGAAPSRADKFYYRLDELLEWLKAKKYEPVRIDRLLKMNSKPKV